MKGTATIATIASIAVFVGALALLIPRPTAHDGNVSYSPTPTSSPIPIRSSVKPPQPSLLQSPQFTQTPTTAPNNGVILHDVPFTPQAPHGQWGDPVFQDACEESSMYMAILWVRGEQIPGPDAVAAEIQDMSTFEQNLDGTFKDRSVKDIRELFRQYYGYENVQVREDVTVQTMRQEIANGNILIVPADGRKLQNPHFTQPGPERHMLVVRGYDPQTNEFITNDPGTRHGQAYRYKTNVLLEAIRDYPTGDHLPIKTQTKRMLVVQPNAER